IHVARLAGLPRETLERAQAVLDSLVVNEVGTSDLVPPPPPTDQMSLFQETPQDPILARLAELSIEHMTPMEAFDARRALLSELDQRG
ncbi:MAG: hypothetical protein VXY94_11860, partial [Planctomycetota bacterium]|nr:hypothetical protein [Planctomycetota bacterium]